MARALDKPVPEPSDFPADAKPKDEAGWARKKLLPRSELGLGFGPRGRGPSLDLMLTDEQIERYRSQPPAVIEQLTGVTLAQQ